MKTAIIGAGRNHNGIGEYISAYFHKNGAQVVAVLGSTCSSSEVACFNLQRYGISAQSHSDFYDMIKNQHIDAVVIASPSHTHYEYVLKCIECGVKYIFCEKPFLWSAALFDISLLSALFAEAEKKNTIIGMNTQWIFALPYYETLCGEIDRAGSGNFFMRMSPSVTGLEMIPESMPHVLSILYSVFGSGIVFDIVFQTSVRSLNIGFSYKTTEFKCLVNVELKTEDNQPRTLLFGFNNRIVKRLIDIKQYSISLEFDDRKIKIIDPLELSVKNFITAAESGRQPLAGKEHIINTTQNLLEICKAGMAYGQVEA